MESKQYEDQTNLFDYDSDLQLDLRSDLEVGGWRFEVGGWRESI